MAFLRAVRRPVPLILQHLLISVLLVLAVTSSAIGVEDALHRSQDFQWSGERLLLHHVDPWTEYLRGDPNHAFVQTQFPNYLPILYVLIVPLGLLPFSYAKLAWALCNVGFAAGSAGLVGKFYGLRSLRLVGLVCLMLIATPTRNSIGNGQQGLLVLLVWSLSLLSQQFGAGKQLSAGISYFKYSFAPPLLLFLLFRRGLRSILLSGIPALVSAGLVWFWLDGPATIHNLPGFAFEPFAVARTGFRTEGGDPNLMNVVEHLLHGLPGRLAAGFAYGLALTLCLGVSYFAFRRHAQRSVQWQLAVMATMSYALFKHHPYDGVVLLFPLAYAITRWRLLKAQFVIALIGYLFFLERGLEAAHLHPEWMQVPECLMLMGILSLTYQLHEEPVQLVTNLQGTSDPREQPVEPLPRQIAA